MAGPSTRGRRFAAWGLASIVLLLAAIASLGALALRQTSVDRAWVERTHAINRGLDELMIALLNAETGMRGFLLSNDEAFLAPYLMGIARVEDLHATVLGQVSDPLQRRRLEELHPLILEREAILERAVRARRDSDFTFERVAPVLLHGHAVMNKLRAAIDELQRREADLLASRNATAERSDRRTASLLLSGCVLGIVAAIGSGLMTRRQALLRQQAQHEVELANGRLEETVARRTAELREALSRALRAEEDVRQQAAQLEARVEQRTRELKELNAEMESFSYAVSHDLTTPLRAIEGFGGALEEDAAGALDEGSRDHLRRIRAATRRMATTIDALLMLSRVARAEVVREPLDLGAMAASVLELLADAEPQRSVAVEVQRPCPTVGDRGLMRTALDNLLGNAWKFTARVDHARISFSCSEVGGEAVFCVRDNGAGFDPAHADKLFHAFQRLHDPALYPGTGIGLATVARVVQRHGGRIWAEGTPGGGAAFFFTLGGRAGGSERA